jgi:Flp pilus assembly protein TadG
MGDRAKSTTRETGENGTALTELVIVVPLLLMVAVLMIYIGRIESAQADVTSAARAGVQAAVVQAGPAAAFVSASTAVTDTLASAHIVCPSPSISTDVSNFVPGGDVSVTVTCVANLAQVTVPGVPGTRTFSATSVAVVDPYRPVT